MTEDELNELTLDAIMASEPCIRRTVIADFMAGNPPHVPYMSVYPVEFRKLVSYAYRRGLLRAAEIARDHFSPEWNGLEPISPEHVRSVRPAECGKQIAAAIEAEAKEIAP